MNYTECFNRSRAAICLQPVFLFFAPVLVPSLASGMEYCHGCTVAPFLVRLNAARCGVLQPVPPLRRSWCLDAARRGVLHPCTVCAVPGASMLPGLECCSRCPLCAVPGASMLPGVECCTRAPFRPSWCASNGAHFVTLYIL